MRDWRAGLPRSWEDDERFPMSDWRYEVGEGDTLLGYADWVANQREFSTDEEQS